MTLYESEEWGDGMLIARATCDCCEYYEPIIVAVRNSSEPRFCGRCWYTCRPEECKYLGDDVTPDDLIRRAHRLGTLPGLRPASGTPQP